MAVSLEEQPKDPIAETPIIDDEDEEPSDDGGHDDDDDDGDENFEDEEDEDEDEEEEEENQAEESKMQSEAAKMEKLLMSIAAKRVPLRVHRVVIKGNTKTNHSLIEAEIEALRHAATLQDILRAATTANARLQSLGIFDSIKITLDSGPPELPDTANVTVQVVEAKMPLAAEIGGFSKPQARSWSVEGSLELKNLFGHGDLWDGSLAYNCDQMSEISAGVSFPRFKGLSSPMGARVSLLTQDWLQFSSYKERSLGLSLGLISSRNHDLACNLSWHTSRDLPQMSFSSIRRQLGHGLLSSLKYTFKIDRRNSPLRPTQGYAFVCSSQIGGLVPDYRSLRFFRQEFDLRCAFPLGFCQAALNFGISGGLNFPWGLGFLNMPSYFPERFFLGGYSSPICSLGGPMTVLGFKSRGLGPTTLQMQIRDDSNVESSDTSSERKFLGGDLALSSFVDLSFDLPLRVFREAGVHGHVFACAGNVAKLTKSAFRDFSFQKFQESYRSSAGFGIVVPTKLFRMEVNYCYILKQLEHDRGKTGLQLKFS